MGLPGENERPGEPRPPQTGEGPRLPHSPMEENLLLPRGEIWLLNLGFLLQSPLLFTFSLQTVPSCAVARGSGTFYVVKMLLNIH